jgi:iron complex outermembrane receptor protein
MSVFARIWKLHHRQASNSSRDVTEMLVRYFYVACLLMTLCVESVSLAAQPDSSEELEQLPSVDNVTQEADELDELLDLDVEQLGQVNVAPTQLSEEVSTVSRQASTVGKSPAAVFVITQEMIRRSGANNIPDVLRMAPGVEVARIDSNKWAISIRGFNNLYASKLLVQIDGRILYSQFFSGVIWADQDVVLADVERIEVVRGPGGTIWGANAVNGIINIITKSPQDTQGILATGGTGTEERGFSTLRYGGKVGEEFHYRVYGKQFERDGGYLFGDEADDWRQARAGFRAEWTPTSEDIINVQGDIFDGAAGESHVAALPTPPFAQPIAFDNENSGENAIVRWTRILDHDTDWSLQAYYDRYGRETPSIDLEQQTCDLDYQYRFPIGERHNVICGAGYRQIQDHFFGSFETSLVPTERDTNLFSYFLQDEMTLIEDRWYLTMGSKFLHNDFTGFEFQPSVRLLWTPSERQSMWAAVSRAVQTPNRFSDDVIFHQFLAPGPTFTRVVGNPNLESDQLLSFEIGYREQPRDDFYWDLATFYNHYEDLNGISPIGAPFFDPTVPGVIVPLTLGNVNAADTYGAELACTYDVRQDWQISGSYSYIYIDMQAPPTDTTAGSSPHNRVYVRSSWNLSRDWQFDLIGRYVDSLPALGVPSYLVGDVRLAWQPYENFEWAVVGRNLFDSPHPEFVDAFSGILGTEVQPEMFTTLTWTY